jgi:DNA invertase Pin-like site-specific DNA recombinase
MGKRAPLRAAGEPRGAAFVSYLRVSTDKQGASGLGLEAQREAIDRHVRSAGGSLLTEFIEVESGKRNDRPEIAKALAACRARRATLIIAKLDRLARNVAFISNLMESGVEFLAADMPMANRLTVHILAAVAEHEREMISARTKAALQAARARGVKLGNPRLRAGDKASAQAAANAKRGQARRRAKDLMPFIEAAQKAGCLTRGQIAEAMMARGIKTPGGSARWEATTVRRVIARAG